VGGPGITERVKLGLPEGVGTGRREELGRGGLLGRPEGVGRTDGVGRPEGVGLPEGRPVGTGGRIVGITGRLKLGSAGPLGRTLGRPPGRVKLGLTGTSGSSGSSSNCGRAVTRLCDSYLDATKRM
jgi:hypothetical protein